MYLTLPIFILLNRYPSKKKKRKTFEYLKKNVAFDTRPHISV